MVSKKELKKKLKRLESLMEYAEKATIAGDKDCRKIREQLECGLAHHSCGHDGHLFKYIGKPAFFDGDAYVNDNLVPGFFSDTEPESDQGRSLVGKFKCKFCDITMTRKMTAEELKAATKLELNS